LPALLNPNSSIYCPEKTSKKTLLEDIKRLVSMAVVQRFARTQGGKAKEEPASERTYSASPCHGTPVHQFRPMQNRYISLYVSVRNAKIKVNYCTGSSHTHGALNMGERSCFHVPSH